MKQTTKFLHIFMCMALGASVALTSCQDYDDDIEALQTQIDENKASIDDILAKIEAGQYVQKVEKMENGLRVTLGDGTVAEIVNGQNGKDGIDGQDGKDGVDGQNGKDGAAATIEINAEGYWVINGVPTDVKAKGEDGKDGVDGADGQDGQDGQDGTNGQDGKPGASAYDLYLASLPEGATPLTQSEWLRTVAPRISATTGNWEVFDLDQNKWVDTKISAAGTDMYVTEVADKSGWMLHTTVNGEKREIFLPAVPATGLTLSYRSMSEDSDEPEYIYSLYDEEGVMLLTGNTTINFKLFGNNIEANKEKLDFFYDVYKTKAAAGLTVVGEPVLTKEENKSSVDCYNVAVATQVVNFEAGQNYKASLNVVYADNSSNSAASEYFNVQTKAISIDQICAIVNNEDKEAEQKYVKLTEGQVFDFVYTDELDLSKEILAGYADETGVDLLPFDEVKVEYAKVKDEKDLFVLDENGVIKVNDEYDLSVAINYVCEMTVSFQVGDKEPIVENFKVTAVRDEPLPAEEAVMYDENGNSTMQLQWSNKEDAKIERVIELHKGANSLYSQFNGRDQFIASIGGSSVSEKTFYLYGLNDQEQYKRVNGVELKWTKGDIPANDVLIVRVDPTTYVAETKYYVSDAAEETLAEQPALHENSIPVSITLGVDLYNAAVTANPLFIVNGVATIDGVTSIEGNEGKHVMKADLASKFTITGADIEFVCKFADPEEEALKAGLVKENDDKLTFGGAEIVLANGEISINGTIDLDELPNIRIIIEPKNASENLTHLTNNTCEIDFVNPIDKENITLKKIDNISVSAGVVSFDLNNFVQEMKDVYGHVIITKGEIVKGDATKKTINWSNTYEVELLDITEADIKYSAVGNTSESLAENFTIENNVLSLTGGIKPTSEIKITVTPKVSTKWGTITLAPIEFSVLPAAN